jgi:hypothetical protein
MLRQLPVAEPLVVEAEAPRVGKRTIDHDPAYV